jgi:hypothetical protein
MGKTGIIQVNRANMKERGISILASVLFHVILLFLLTKLVPSVRIQLFRHAADVRIVDLKTMSFPRIAGLSEAETSGSQSPQTSPEVLSVQGTYGLPQISPEPGVVYLKNMNFGRSMEPTKLSFDLVPTPQSEGSFSLGIDRKIPGDDLRKEKETGEDPDFSKTHAQPLSSFPFDRIITNKRGEDLSGQINPYVFNPSGGNDLTPWVRQVVDKIRNNWNPPPIEESIALGMVKILLIIGKKGNLIAAEIVEPSDFHVFDQTTTAAIRSSVPFPPLPSEFPYERLEAFLVFEFHE